MNEHYLWTWLDSSQNVAVFKVNGELGTASPEPHSAPPLDGKQRSGRR